jgi:hypothetical protein
MRQTPLCTRAEREQEVRRFVVLRDQLAHAGHSLCRTVDVDGVSYLASCFGVTRRFEQLPRLEVFVDLVTGVIDALVAEGAD